jgi:DNA-binding transcriptional LysR family regulator
MELRHIRYFVALCETQNFRRAAERLNISQPPLTVAIRSLEQELGTALFIRTSRGVQLTQAGQSALASARSTLASAESFRTAVREGDAGERGVVRIGFVGSATFELLPRIIPAFRKRYPKVDCTLEEATSVDISRRLQAGGLDVGILRLPLQESAAIRAWAIDRDEFFLAVPVEHRFAGRKRLRLETCADEPFILSDPISVLRAQALLACHAAGFTPNVAQEAAQISAIISLVRSGLGVALVPGSARAAWREGVRFVALEQSVPIDIGLALPKRHAIPAAENFAAIVDSQRLSAEHNTILD